MIMDLFDQLGNYFSTSTQSESGEFWFFEIKSKYFREKSN